jgi:hypothetical protein
MFLSTYNYYYDWDILRYTDENDFFSYIKFWLIIFFVIFLTINILSGLFILYGVDILYDHLCLENENEIIYLFIYDYEIRKN